MILPEVAGGCVVAVVLMSRTELARVDTLARLDRGDLPAADAALLAGVCERQLYRLLKRYRAGGAAALASGKRGRPSNRRLSASVSATAIALVRAHYPDFGPTFAAEKLLEAHGLRISKETLRKLMIVDGLWRDRKARAPRVHQPRYRRDCVGELVQIDGSHHRWFEKRGPEATLLVFIDDATSRLMHLKMAPTESALAYMQAAREYIEAHGKPVAFYSDKHSVFRITRASSKRPDGMTQFSRALSDLNIEILCANSCQAKGRVERANSTLQDRLVKEMRLAGISSIEAANGWMLGFIATHNAKFGKPPRNAKDLHRPLAAHDDLDEAMAWREERTVTAALTLHYNKLLILLAPSDFARGLVRRKVSVFDYPDGRVAIRYDGTDLPYTVFDKIRQVRQADIVDNKHLDAALDMARMLQATLPARKRNIAEPSRRSQKEHLFPSPADVNADANGLIVVAPPPAKRGRPPLPRRPSASAGSTDVPGIGAAPG